MYHYLVVEARVFIPVVGVCDLVIFRLLLLLGGHLFLLDLILLLLGHLLEVESRHLDWALVLRRVLKVLVSLLEHEVRRRRLVLRHRLLVGLQHLAVDGR